MMELITIAAAQAIAKIALDKFVEGSAGELGKELTKPVAEKVKQLGNAVWQRIKGEPKAAELLKAVEANQPEAIATLEKGLHRLWEQDQQFAQEIQPLAQEIQQMLVQIETVNAKNVQQIFGGQGLQVNEKQDQPIIQIQGNPTLNFGSSSKDSSKDAPKD
jgi:uncharacterized protein (DUF3084 family)